MDPALKAMLTDTVSHAAYVGQNAYGQPQYTTPVTRPARIAFKVTTVTNAQGQERTSNTIIYFDGDVVVTLRIKSRPDTTAPAIQAVYAPTDPLTGLVDHLEVLL